MTEQFDVVVIGGGPGGYVAAIRAAQLGFKVACVEARGALGGTCLNVGCIPSKALLQSSEAYYQAKHKVKDLGVTYGDVGFDLKMMMTRKDKIVKNLTGGVEGLFKKNKVTYLVGWGAFDGPGRVRVTAEDKTMTSIETKNVIIATGSAPIELGIAKFDEKAVVSSTGALDFDKVPKHLVVIGGGVIGLEMGSVWARLGAKVTIIEAMKSILATMDEDVVRVMNKVLKAEGIEIHINSRFTACEKKKNGLDVSFEKDGKTETVFCDKLLVAVGRRAFTQNLGLDSIGLVTEPNGKVPVDGHFRTNVAGVYAIGDVIKGAMLAHKAEEEGVACAEIIAGKPGHVNYEAVPNVVYTWPEVASVGKTEEEARAAGIDIRIGKFPFSANGRAKCLGETEGFVKIIADARSDRIIGAHIVGPNASEIIGELAVAVEYGASSEDVARSVHAHPTLTEAIKEAALGVDKRAIHI